MIETVTNKNQQTKTDPTNNSRGISHPDCHSQYSAGPAITNACTLTSPTSSYPPERSSLPCGHPAFLPRNRLRRCCGSISGVRRVRWWLTPLAPAFPAGSGVGVWGSCCHPFRNIWKKANNRRALPSMLKHEPRVSDRASLGGDIRAAGRHGHSTRRHPHARQRHRFEPLPARDPLQKRQTQQHANAIRCMCECAVNELPRFTIGRIADDTIRANCRYGTTEITNHINRPHPTIMHIRTDGINTISRQLSGDISASTTRVHNGANKTALNLEQRVHGPSGLYVPIAGISFVSRCPHAPFHLRH